MWAERGGTACAFGSWILLCVVGHDHDEGDVVGALGDGGAHLVTLVLGE